LSGGEIREITRHALTAWLGCGDVEKKTLKGYYFLKSISGTFGEAEK